MTSALDPQLRATTLAPILSQMAFARDQRLQNLFARAFSASLHSFAAVLGNDIAINAYREGKLPLPDGAIIVALHYRHVASEENNKVFGQAQSFVPGPPTNIQFMVKDSKKYAATGGWAFAQFDNGKPLTDKAMLKSCFECHQAAKDRDFVFAHYAP